MRNPWLDHSCPPLMLRRISPLADNPPKPWRRRVFHRGSAGFARGAPFPKKGGKAMIGKRIRMERIMNRETGKTVIVPMDHGVTIGPVAGLIDLQETVNAVADGGANAFVFHKGGAEAGHPGKGKDVGLIIHLSASTQMAPDPSSKTMVCTVEEAIKLGADGVSIHVNLGAEDEKFMLNDLGN